jgi:hypothetical protein
LHRETAASNCEIGLEKIRELHPHANDTNHQFITRWVEGELLTERIIRLKNEYPTTEREFKKFNPDENYDVRCCTRSMASVAARH